MNTYNYSSSQHTYSKRNTPLVRIPQDSFQSSMIIFFLCFVLLFGYEYYRFTKQVEAETSEEIIATEIEELKPIKGIFLLFLAVSGNFIAEVLGCNIRKVLTEKMLVKHIIVIFSIYFSIGFTSSITVPPHVHLRKSILIWFFFIIFNKMTPMTTNLTILSLLSILFLQNWIEYFKAVDAEKYKSYIDTYLELIHTILIVMLVIMFYGFSKYFIKTYDEKKGQGFNYRIFLFGQLDCESLEDNNNFKGVDNRF